MPGAVEQVAALEAETAEAVTAAQVAQDAAAAALASAAVLENQVVAETAQHIAEVESDVAQNKDDVSWLKERMTALESGQSAMLATLDTMAATLLVLTAEPEATPPAASTESQSATSETPPLSSVAVVDLQAAENPAASPAPEKPSHKPKRHRLL